MSSALRDSGRLQAPYPADANRLAAHSPVWKVPVMQENAATDDSSKADALDHRESQVDAALDDDFLELSPADLQELLAGGDSRWLQLLRWC